METLIQTRVPTKYGKAIAAKAAQEGISVAALLRKLAMRAVEKQREAVTKAWVISQEECKNSPDRIVALQQGEPQYLLGLVAHLSSTETIFSVSYSFKGAWLPQSAKALSSHSWFHKWSNYRFVLAGGGVWKIVRVIEVNRGDGEVVEVTLALDLNQ